MGRGKHHDRAIQWHSPVGLIGAGTGAQFSSFSQFVTEAALLLDHLKLALKKKPCIAWFVICNCSFEQKKINILVLTMAMKSVLQVLSRHKRARQSGTSYLNQSSPHQRAGRRCLLETKMKLKLIISHPTSASWTGLLNTDNFFKALGKWKR